MDYFTKWKHSKNTNNVHVVLKQCDQIYQNFASLAKV